MKRYLVLPMLLGTVILLAACSIGRQAEQPPSQAKPPGTTTPAKEPAQTTPKPPAPQEPIKPTTESRPLHKKIEVKVEGERELREATLAKSQELGYSLYVLKNFSLEAEEPGKDVLLSKYDGEFFVRIERVHPNTGLDEYKQRQMSAYQGLGKVTEMTPANLFQEQFRDAKYTFLIEINTKGQPKSDIMMVVKEFNGQLFQLSFFMPLKEAAEGLTPSLWAMAATLQAEPN